MPDRGGNLPDLAFVRWEGERAEAGNVASFSVNLQKKPYVIRSGALTRCCLGCPALEPCFEGESPPFYTGHLTAATGSPKRWTASCLTDAPTV